MSYLGQPLVFLFSINNKALSSDDFRSESLEEFQSFHVPCSASNSKRSTDEACTIKMLPVKAPIEMRHVFEFDLSQMEMLPISQFDLSPIEMLSSSQASNSSIDTDSQISVISVVSEHENEMNFTEMRPLSQLSLMRSNENRVSDISNGSKSNRNAFKDSSVGNSAVSSGSQEERTGHSGISYEEKPSNAIVVQQSGEPAQKTITPPTTPIRGVAVIMASATQEQEFVDLSKYTKREKYYCCC